MKKTKEEIWKEWCAKDLSWTESALGAMQEYTDQCQLEVMPSDEEIMVYFNNHTAEMYNNGYVTMPVMTRSGFIEFAKWFKSQLKPAEKEEKKLIVIDETILQKAIDTWGMEAQIEMVKEECLELAIALQKLNRTRGDLEEKEKNIVDEIADVTIMIKQAHRIFSIDKINERIEYKMKRLEKRLIENL